MKEILKKNWDYTLYSSEDTLIMSVLCGSVALYTLNIELNELEKKKFNRSGESFINDFAKDVRETPSIFMSRHIDI